MKTKLHFLALSLLALVYLSCKDEQKQDQISEKPNRVVLIFQDMPVNTRYKWEDGHTSGLTPSHEICYIDDHSIIRHLTPDYAPESDTITLELNRDVIEILHTYKGTDHLSYRFEKGDSVLFTYEGRKPFAKILNREVSDAEVNYSIRRREKLSDDYFPGLQRTHRSFALTKEFDSIPWSRKAEAALQVGIKAALEEFDAEAELLDSLYDSKSLSKQAYDFYHTNRTMDMANARFDVDFGFDHNPVDGISEVPTPEQLVAINLDSASTRFYYHKLLEEKRRALFTSKTVLIKLPNGSHRDSRQAYDLIAQSDSISTLEKDLMLVKTIGLIYDQFDLEDRQEYWEKFRRDVSDPVYLEYVEKKYEFDKPVVDEVRLTTYDGEQLTMSQALEKHKGKVIYVDFWASWCAPCIRTIPDAKKLQQEYAGEDIVFMYLSIDEKADNWKNASQKHALNGETPNYIITNKMRSRNMDYLNVTSIPRYMIYDRNGELVEGDAPRPDTPEVRKKLDQYLAKT